MDKIYDIIFIGTGPIHLLKSYLLLKKNPLLNVLFLDTNEKIGGAWYSEKLYDCWNTESGCHIWSYCPEVYHFLESELNIELQKMSPPPYFVYNKLKLPYSVKDIFDSYKNLAKNALTLNFIKLKRNKVNPKARYLDFDRKNKYPINGSSVLIDSLFTTISSYPNVEFKLKAKACTIQITKERLLVGVDHAIIKTNAVNLTSVSTIEKIITLDKTITINSVKKEYIHFLIRLNKKPLREISYHRLMLDPIIHRITDISYQTLYNEYLILVGIKEDAFAKNGNTIFQYVSKVLNQNRIIDGTFNLELVKEYRYPTFYIEEEIKKDISIIDSRISLNHSTDLMYGFYHLLKGFKAI